MTALAAGMLPSPAVAVDIAPTRYHLEATQAPSTDEAVEVAAAPRVPLSDVLSEPSFVTHLDRWRDLESLAGMVEQRDAEADATASTPSGEAPAEAPATDPSPPPAAVVAATPEPVRTPVPTATATPEPAAAETPSSPSPPPASVALSAKEAGLLREMNARRTAAGLEPLVARADLTQVARGRCQDMVAKDYFGHFHEGGVSAYSMLTSAGVSYGSAGENLAKVPGDDATAVQVAIEALMASPTHRENILRPEYRYVGVGAAVDADGVTVLTTIFTDR